MRSCLDVLLGMGFVEFTRILGNKCEQFRLCCITNLHKMWCKYKKYSWNTLLRCSISSLKYNA